MTQSSGVRFFENNLLYDVPVTSALSLFRSQTNTAPVEYWGSSLFLWSRLRNGEGFLIWKLQVSAVRGQESLADKFKCMFLSAPQWVQPFPSNISPLPLCFPLWHREWGAPQMCSSSGRGLSCPLGMSWPCKHNTSTPFVMLSEINTKQCCACSLAMEK